MVTICAERKKHIRRSAPLKTLEKHGAETLKGERPIIEIGQGIYLVPSRSADPQSESTDEEHEEHEEHEVRHRNGLWTCSCPYYMAGHANCSHTCAVRMMLKMQEKAKSAVGKRTYVEVPEIRCPECGKCEFHASTSYPTCFGRTTVYKCDNPECGKRFTFRPGFKKKWFGDNIITDVLVDTGSGHPPGRILERLEKNGIKISERTTRRWIKEYGTLVERFAATLSYDVGGEWSADEKYLKTHPNGSKSKHYLTAMLDNTTGLVLSYDVTDNKSGYDATGLTEAAIALAGRVPDLFTADKLNGYKIGFLNAILSRNPLAIMIADAAINGVHLNNNKRERLNGEFWDCLYRARGFNSLIPGLVRLTVVYHNFIHKGSRKETPAEAAGVMVEGPDKLKTLIQNAALAKV